MAWPFLSHNTPLESPTLATVSTPSCTNANTAVDPIKMYKQYGMDYKYALFKNENHDNILMEI
jgi:hypothetical protein